MIRTRFTERFGAEHPVLQGPTGGEPVPGIGGDADEIIRGRRGDAVAPVRDGR